MALLHQKREDHDRLLLFPLIFIIAILPLIVYRKEIPVEGILTYYWNTSSNIDTFSYYKVVWFFIATFLSMVSFIAYHHVYDTFRVKLTSYYIPIALYSLFVLLSSLFSEHLYVALFGFPDRYEGMFVLLCYMIVLFITINLVNVERHVKLIIGALSVSGLVLGIIGLLQYIGFDYINADFVRRMILPSSLYKEGVEFSVRFSSYRIYLTMYNPNYVGSYMVMLFSLSLVIYILVKKRELKIGSGAFSVLMFINLMGSHSRAGLVGSIAAIVVMLFLLRKQLYPNLKYLIIIIICYSISFMGMNYISEGSLARGLSLARGVRDQTLQYEEGVSPFRDIQFDTREMSIITEDRTLIIGLDDNNSLLFFNSERESIPFEYYQGSEGIEIDLKNEEYEHFQFSFDVDDFILHFTYDRIEAEFVTIDDYFYILGFNGEPNINVDIESWFFENRERFASARGFIWSRSLPLLRTTWFLGTGADTYAVTFPQNDNIGKLRAFTHTRIIVDKPHNLYLQTAINTGLPSLLALLSLFTLYSFHSLRSFWRSNFDNLFSIVGVGLFIAFIGYAVAGLFNDSLISVAPVFWVLLGLGISINLILEEKMNGKPK